MVFKAHRKDYMNLYNLGQLWAQGGIKTTKECYDYVNIRNQLTGKFIDYEDLLCKVQTGTWNSNKQVLDISSSMVKLVYLKFNKIFDKQSLGNDNFTSIKIAFQEVHDAKCALDISIELNESMEQICRARERVRNAEKILSLISSNNIPPLNQWPMPKISIEDKVEGMVYELRHKFEEFLKNSENDK